MKSFLLSMLAFTTLIAVSPAQTTLWSESFETDGDGVRYDASQICSNNGGHFFARMDGSLSPGFNVTGQDGSYYWGVNDPTEPPCNFINTRRVTSRPIDIRGYDNLTFKGLFAVSGTPQWDIQSQVWVEYSMNNGLTWTKILQFTNSPGPEGQNVNNTAAQQDTDFDGKGDGVLLTNTFAEFDADITERSTFMLVRVSLTKLNSPNENVAFDFLRIEGNNVGCDPDTGQPTALCKNLSNVVLDGMGMATIAASDIDGGSFDDCTLIGDLTLSLSQTTLTCAEVGDAMADLMATDEDANTGTCTATVTVKDNTNPTAQCRNATVALDADGHGVLSASQVDDGSSDACGIASMTISTADFYCTDIGNHVVTLTVKDPSNRSSTCTATVTVVDELAPVAQCKSTAVQVIMDENGQGTYTPGDLDDGSYDNCSAVTLTFADGTTEKTLGCSGIGVSVTAVQVKVTDAYANESICVGFVTPNDNMQPVALCKDTTVALDASGQVEVISSIVNNGSYDNCGITYESLAVNYYCNDLGPHTTTFTVRDAQNNTSSCTGIVTVIDSIGPDAQCKNATVELDADGNGTLNKTDVDNGSSDACGIASSELSQSTFSCSDAGSNTVTMTVTDVNNNSNTCTATVFVADHVAPVALCKNITVTLDALGEATILDTDINDGSYDNCGLVFFPQTIHYDCEDIGPHTVTFTARDANHQTSSCTGTVTVEEGADLPSGWTGADVGSNANGSAEYKACTNPGTFTLSAQGYTTNITDVQYTVFKTVCGDAEIIAHVAGITPMGGWAGIQLRETTAQGSKKFTLKTQLNTLLRREIRSTTFGPTNTMQMPIPPNHTWLRLVRTGNTFTAYSSVDGVNWAFRSAATISMDGCIMAGLFVESINNTATTTAAFDNISVSGGAPEPLAAAPAGNIILQVVGGPQVKLYPNPTNGLINLQMDTFEDWPQEVQVSVFNSFGAQVGTVQTITGGNNTTLHQLTGMPNGVYWIQVQGEGFAPIIQRVVLEH